MKRALIAGGLIAAVVAGIALSKRGGGRHPTAAPAKGTDGAAARGPDGAATAAGTPTPPVAPVAKAAIDRARRTEIAGAIAAARRSARTHAAIVPPAGTLGGPGAAGSAAPIDETPGELTKDEIRTGVRDVIPMLVDCYSTEIERDPRLAGALLAHLTVDSEPDLGMVVTVGGLDIDGALGKSAEFRDCVGATLESVVLPPLPVGGHVDIDYPLAFSNDPDPPDAGARQEAL